MKLSPPRSLVLLSALVASGVAALIAWTSSLEAVKFAPTSRSTTVLLTGDDARLLVVNRESNSLAILRVRGLKGATITDATEKIAEVTVGLEPRCVTLDPKERQAYVTNGISGTVSVVELTGPNAFTVTGEIQGLTEPRGCALSPSGKFLYVANHTAGTVSIIDTTTRTIVNTETVGGNPMAIAVTNDGDADDNDETVFVTQFFAELIPGGPGEGRDLGKRGVVKFFTGPFTAPNPETETINLSPLANSGFTANRTNFCPNLNAMIHPPHVANPIFCPDPAATVANTAILQNPQGVFPNQLASALVRGDRLWLLNIGAQPEPPVRFNVNVQALVHAVNTITRAEVVAEHVNLNVEIAAEPAPANPTASLSGLFLNDVLAMDANQDGSVFLIVSRGGNYVARATRNATTGRLTLGTPIVRFQTGNLPSGVVISKDGKRAYANNEANVSVTALNLETNTVITPPGNQLPGRDIPSGEPAAPGTFEHAVLVGKLAFFTALGIPDNGIFDIPIREFNPLLFRGKQSNNAWSSCGSCHPDGLSDGVTWSFAAGPRQAIPLDGTFAKDTSFDQRMLNWSSIRGSNTDFNNNSRAVQGGCGFASAAFVTPPVVVDPPAQCTSSNPAATPANPAIYDHGVTQGGSDALDAQTLWIFAAVRPLKQPQPTDAAGLAALAAGRTVFQMHCASCHGGAKWSKSQIFHRDNPAFSANPAMGGVPLDPGVASAANQIITFTCGTLTFRYLDGVGTFNVADPLEIREGNGQTAAGAAGFNAPSLFSIRYHAPYLHRGQAQTLAGVFQLHTLPGGSTIEATLLAQDQQNLLAFLNAIDGTTDQLRSAGDDFRDAIKTPCPGP
jgi:YVTN family beta-propeller protein